MSIRNVIRLAVPSAVALGLLGVAMPASAQTSTVIIAPTAPPPPRVETIPSPPSSTVTWVQGHWTWNGTGWEWHDGRYIARPQATAVWEPGHWEQRADGGYVWVGGHWRS